MPILFLALATTRAGEQDGPFRRAPEELSSRSSFRVGELIEDLLLPGPAMGPKGLVIAMRSGSCPVSGRYRPTLARLEEGYADKGVSFLSLDVSDPAAGPALKALGATTTTEVFLLDRARTLRYRGAIDDQYGIGYSKPKATRTYLEDAIEDLLAERSVRREATTAPGCVLSLPLETPEEGAISYHGRVSRILQRNCQECHRAGGAGPFALESYGDAKEMASMIGYVVENEIMPPWFAAPGVGHWANDRSLSGRDRKALLDWVASGAPEGDRRDGPLPRVFAGEWRIGVPDAIVEIPEPVSVPAEGVVDYQYVYVKTDFPGDRWIQKMEIRPTAPQVTHHVLIFLEEPGRKDIDDKTRKPGEPFFQGGLRGYFASTVPGQQPSIYPPGMAKLLPKGAWLKFQLHYTPNGDAAVDRTRFGFVFAEGPPRFAIETSSATETEFEIPPGAPNHEVTGAHRFDSDAVILSFFPHMHLRGKASRYELLFPDGRMEVLLDVPRYDFNWQLHYVPEEPVFVPKGAVLRSTGWFDNSEDNPANPDPTQAVRFGEQTWEEMMIGFFDWYDPSPRD
jgi:mono/diheme cytochrome c family protein